MRRLRFRRRAIAISAISRLVPRVRGGLWLTALLMRAIDRRLDQDFVIARRFGFRLSLHPSQYVDRDFLCRPRFFDPDERRLLQRHLRPGDTFFDIGAYIGIYSLLASRWVGSSGLVVAFEPHPESRRRLEANIQLNACWNILALPYAVSDARGEASLNVPDDGNQGGARLVQSGGEGVRVEKIPLGEAVVQFGRGPVAALKIDIEGAELGALESLFSGAPESVWPGLMIVEHHSGEEGQMDGPFFRLAKQAGYRVQKAGRNSPNYLLRLNHERLT